MIKLMHTFLQPHNPAVSLRIWVRLVRHDLMLYIRAQAVGSALAGILFNYGLNLLRLEVMTLPDSAFLPTYRYNLWIYVLITCPAETIFRLMHQLKE